MQSDGKDLLSSFGSVIPPDATDYLGTVIRLPLRSASSQKRISSFVPPIEWVKGLFADFVKEELDIEMLFLKNVERIELVHIDAGGVRTQCALAQVLYADSGDRVHRKFSAQADRQFATFRIQIASTRLGVSAPPKDWRIAHWNGEADVHSALRRLVGTVSDEDLRKDKLFAHAACAFPLSEVSNDGFGGRLFTLLPLPISTNFPLHCHAIFALTPTRQALKNSKEKGLGGRDRYFVPLQ